MENSEDTPERANEVDIDLPSCDGCRRRKLRCSREWPTCSHCRRLTSRCTYEYQRKKPGLKGGAVEALSRRVEALENAVFDSPDGVKLLPSSSAGLPEPQNSNITSSDPHALGGILSVLTREIHQLNSNLTSPSMRTAPVVTPSPSSIHDLTHDDGAGSRAENPRKRIRLNSYARINSADAYSLTPQTLLARSDVVEELLDAYFENIHHWIPILHQTRFRRKLADKNCRDQCFIILHAILVATMRFVDEKRVFVSVQDIQNEVKRSRHYVMFNAMGDLTLENLQALIIIAFTDIGQGETSKAWSTIGSLARTVQYLHLSVEDTDLVEPAALLSNLPSLPPPDDWIEEEERRRLFWNIFLLDRFCSITTGWNVSLTADDVCRRLPIDGGLWARNQPALTPYLGIWDHSAAKIGHTITFLPSKYESPGKTVESSTADGSGAGANSGSRRETTATSVEVLKIGAFAYYVESVESLSRINTYFVQQKIDFTNRQDVFSWLTRFKELDLRLVHWKMYLPQKWKNPSVNPAPATTTAMDPNMTLAHITHNTASILLHQRIAYPRQDLKHLKLPNACSADTCYVAATETANITTKYLEHAPVRRVLAPHFAICVFVSAKVLLVHSLHYKVELAPEFWTLVECLETMSSKWKGRLMQVENEPVPLAGSLATQLRQLHDRCQKDPDNQSLAFFGQVSRAFRNDTEKTPSTEDQTEVHHPGDTPSDSRGAMGRAERTPQSEPHMANCNSSTLLGNHNLQRHKPSPAVELDQDDGQSPSVQRDVDLPSIEGAADDLSVISQGLMDQSFLEMNRIINFDDFMFITNPNDFPSMTGL